MLRSLFQLLNRDLTGRSWERTVAHPYFTSLVYFGHKDSQRAYWEAEVPRENGPAFIAYLRSPPAGPSHAEERFCREIADHEVELGAKCLPFISGAIDGPVLDSAPRLVSIEVPDNGDVTKAWSAFFSAGEESFVVRIARGEPISVARDDEAG